MIKAFLLLVTGSAVLWRIRSDKLLPWTVLWALAGVFVSRAYWLTPWGTLRAEQLAFLVLFGHCLSELLRRRRWPRFGPLPLLLLAMIPWMVLGSWLGGPLPAASLRKTLIYFPYLAGFAALCHFLDSQEKVAAAWDFLIRFGSLMLAISLAGYFLFFSGVDLGMVRVEYGIVWLRGSMVNPNIFGAAAAMVLVATLSRFLHGNEGWRRGALFDLGALIIASASLLVSFSRAAWLLSLLAVAASLFFFPRRRGRRLAAAAAILATVLAGGAFTAALSRSFNARLQLDPRLRPATAGEFGEPALDEYWNSSRHGLTPTAMPFRERLINGANSARWRVEVSVRALRDWAASPIIGRGTDSLLLSNPDYPQDYIPITAVAILHDWGIMALLLYAAFLLLAGWRLWKRLLRPSLYSVPFPAIFTVFVLLTLHAQVSTTLQLAFFWVLSAVFAAAAGLPPEPADPAVAAGDPPGGG